MKGPPPPPFEPVTCCGAEGVGGSSRNPDSTRRLRGGSFLAECSRRQQADHLLSTTTFIDRKVTVSIHKAWNSSRGEIRCRDLSDRTEEEICEELREQGVDR